jgi:bifunctional non-homologous end joining protein LigD
MARERTAVAAVPLPASYEPQLAALVKAPPDGDGWLHELKYDGYRIGCRIDATKKVTSVSLLSRRGKDWSAAFPEVIEAARRLGVRQAFLDGEVAVLQADGRTSFQALQNAFGGTRRPGLTYFAFDLLHLDGEDLTGRSLDERKEVLAKLIPPGRTSELFRYSDHVIGRGAAFLAEACRVGLEGIVSKQRSLPYQPGRNSGWVKSKCTRRQEFVVGGFTDPEGSRQGIGALLIGVYDERKQLVFAGKVGTGFTRKSAHDLRQRLNALEQPRTPFQSQPPSGWLGANAHWVKPVLVAEVAFTEWTDDGKIRHPSFQGLREDKTAEEVVAEKPKEAPVPSKVKARGQSKTRKIGTAKGAKDAKDAKDGTKAKITHPERIVYPEISLTKGELAAYYEAIAPWMVPHVEGRPLTIVRCPQGLVTGDDRKDCFYMKHSQVWAPPNLERVPIKEKTKVGTYLVLKDPAGLQALAQMGVLEIHTWNSLADDVERPNRVVFDLDPGPKVPFTEVIEAAILVRDTLASLGLESFVKNTGGRGLHVMVPIRPEGDWDTTFNFTRDLSAAIAARQPNRYTISVPKAGRERKILIDYLRNNRASTSVAAFSSRARPTAPVSTPLGWDELSPKIPPNHFTVRNLPERLRKLRRDPWEGYWKCRQRLTAQILRAVQSVG